MIQKLLPGCLDIPSSKSGVSEWRVCQCQVQGSFTHINQISQQCTNAQAKYGPCIQWDISQSLKREKNPIICYESDDPRNILSPTGDNQRTDATRVPQYEVSRRVKPKPKRKNGGDQHSEGVCLLEIAGGAQNAEWQWLHKRPQCHWIVHSGMISVVSLWRNVRHQM